MWPRVYAHCVPVYARTSRDRSGEKLGVKRQLADWRAETDWRG